MSREFHIQAIPSPPTATPTYYLKYQLSREPTTMHTDLVNNKPKRVSFPGQRSHIRVEIHNSNTVKVHRRIQRKVHQSGQWTKAYAAAVL